VGGVKSIFFAVKKPHPLQFSEVSEGGSWERVNMTDSQPISLYEDWRLRRDRLPADTDEQLVRMQAQLLDYLLSRYRGDPDAQRPARFPLATTLVLNRRAIVVHHHLKTARSGGTKSAAEVRDRVSQIVDRMLSTKTITPQARKSTGPTSFSSVSGNVMVATARSATHIARLRHCLKLAGRELRSVWSNLFRPRRMRNKKFRCRFEQFSDPRNCDHWLLERLLWHPHPKTKLYAFNAWVDRARAGSRDHVSEQLFDIVRESMTDKELDRLRSLLADNNVDLRRAALEAIATCGTLDDVALLCDLLALPRQPQDFDDERAVLGSTIQQIAVRLTGQPIEI
jgi:hypothetical protein